MTWWLWAWALIQLLWLLALRLWLRLHHTRRLMSCLGSNALARPTQITPPGWWPWSMGWVAGLALMLCLWYYHNI